MVTHEQKQEILKRKADSMLNLPGILQTAGVAKGGDAITGFTEYRWRLYRDEDRHWLYYAEWVDPDGEGHRILFPHSVVDALIKGQKRLMDEAKKRRSRKGYETRQRKLVDTVAETVLPEGATEK